MNYKKIARMQLVDFFIRLTLYIYPNALAIFISKCRNFIASRRFCYLSGNALAEVHLEKPFYISGYKYIKIGSFYSLPGLRMECLDSFAGEKFRPSIKIGENVIVNFRCHIGAINKIVIGNNVLIGSSVLITDHSHGYNDKSDIEEEPIKRRLYSKGPVVIDDNVWIGENAAILPNVHIGRNSVIGANSVVIRDVPAYTVVAGNPAKVIRSIH